MSALTEVGSRLLHYSSKPIGRVRSVSQGEWKRGRHDKPCGLWVSVEGEDDWRQWCEAESFGNPAEQFCYVVTLAASASILRLTTAAAVLRFTARYGFDPYMGATAGRTCMSGQGIRWDEVAAKYDGIIIAPYCWKLRLDRRAGWYYGWDCASGCIWNARAVERLTLDRAQVSA